MLPLFALVHNESARAVGLRLFSFVNSTMSRFLGWKYIYETKNWKTAPHTETGFARVTHSSLMHFFAINSGHLVIVR